MTNSPTPLSDDAVALRRAYEADTINRMRRAGIGGEPYFKTHADGSYRRTDLEADYQTFAASMKRPPRLQAIEGEG